MDCGRIQWILRSFDAQKPCRLFKRFFPKPGT